MKNLKYSIYLLSIFVMLGCSKDDEIFEEPEVVVPPDETPENPPEENPNEPAAYYPDPGEVHSYLVDAAATAETAALFYHLKKSSKTNFVVGQQDAFSAHFQGAAGGSDMKKVTGSDPGLLGLDFSFITDNSNNGQANNWFYQQEQNIIKDAVEAYDKG